MVRKKCGLSLDGIDLYDRKFLAVAALVTVAFAALFLENDDFFAAFVFEDGGLDRGAFDKRGAKLYGVALTDGQNGINGDGIVLVGVLITVYEEDIPLFYGELASLCFNRRFHWKKQAEKEAAAEKARYFVPGSAGWTNACTGV
jgi:hypothetical protein